MQYPRTVTRRSLLRAGGLAVAGLALAGCAGMRGEARHDEEEAGVSPNEDLMREHGALARLLLVNEEAVRRLDEAQPMPADVIGTAARLVQRFVHGYHEQLEEQQVFPQVRKAGLHENIIMTLLEQHRAGRGVTERVIELAGDAAPQDPDKRRLLAADLRAFSRMYRPHKAREDTVIFPSFHDILTPDVYEELGEKFEDQETTVLGRDGFTGVLRTVAEMETAMGVADLSQFTPAEPASPA